MLNSTRKILFRLVLIFTIVSTIYAKKLPTYVRPCKEDDPQLGKCILDSTKKALPSFLNGDKKYDIPPLTPLVVEKAEIPGNNLHISFKNIKVLGIENVEIQEMKLDTKKQHLEVKFRLPVIAADTDYKVDGKVLVVPIKGEGRANITLTDPEFVYLTDYIKEKGSDGDEYVKISNPDFKYKFSRAYFNLENLFNGDKNLGETTNKFLNENWEDVVKELAPPILEVVKAVSTQILSGIFKNVPYKDLWTK